MSPASLPGRAISYNYTGAVDNAISRLTSISDSSAILENYHYLGQSTVVRRAHAEPGVDLSYVKVIGEPNGDAGDIYTGLDRFGRVVDQRWRTAVADVDRFQYTYDHNGNRLSRTNAIDSALNEIYNYDGMNRLTSSQRGARIVSSYFYHKGSYFDTTFGVQAALDTGKSLARESSGVLTLGYQNMINTSRGINGLVFDIQDLASTNLTAADFQFQMSPQNVYDQPNNPPGSWAAAPAPTQIEVIPASGSTPARVILRWADNAIKDRWLRVTLKSTANTGLAEDEIFYAGHLLGDATGDLLVRISDILEIRSHLAQQAGVSDVRDIDKDGMIRTNDILAARSNLAQQLSVLDTAANPLADLTQSQRWTLDGQGNWIGLENNWGGVQSRTHNSQNQVTQVGGATLSFDAAGNMTTDEQGRTLKYDAWNRLVQVQNGGTTVKYQYDGLKRRITEQIGTAPQRVLYYSANWQVLEERESGVVQAQQVWSPVYVDALILRDRNADGNNTNGPNGDGLEQRHYVAQDANFNVTALIDGSTGAVVERYYYQAYGVPTVLDANFVPRANGQSQFAWRYLHQGGRFDWAASYYHFRNRDLSPTLGRWLNQDPIGFQGSKWNLYEYVEGTPTGGLDPNGLYAVRCAQVYEHGFLGSFLRHCDIQQNCTPGPQYEPTYGGIVDITCYPITIDRSPSRKLNFGCKTCANATDSDIADCLRAHPGGRPMLSRMGSNCQSDSIQSLGRCCLKSGWYPNFYAGPMQPCVSGHYVTTYHVNPRGTTPVKKTVFVCDVYLPKWYESTCRLDEVLNPNNPGLPRGPRP